jgi:hypothetical protein
LRWKKQGKRTDDGQDDEGDELLRNATTRDESLDGGDEPLGGHASELEEAGKKGKGVKARSAFSLSECAETGPVHTTVTRVRRRIATLPLIFGS